jgi:hypothetical protein
MPKRPSHPAANVRDDREAPLLESAGRREDNHEFPKNGSKTFFTEGIDMISDNTNRRCSSGKSN